MEYIYASMLIHKAGNKVDESNLKKVLEAAGVQVDDTRVKATVAALDGVNIEEAISKAAVTTPVAVAPVTGGGAPAEEKKTEKSAEEEKKGEESAAAGLGALFG